MPWQDAPEIIRPLKALASRITSNKIHFSHRGAAEFYLRLLLFPSRMQSYFHLEEGPRRRGLLKEVQQLLELYDENDLDDPRFEAWIRRTIDELRRSEQMEAPSPRPWGRGPFPERLDEVPAMLSSDGRRYFRWLGRHLAADGDCVELGCWLGGTTACLADGLASQANVQERCIHVFDPFVWEKWMSRHAPPGFEAAQELRKGQSFRHLFLDNCADCGVKIKVHQRHISIGPEGGQDPLWSRGKIALWVQDLPDQYALAQGAWSIFAPFFIPGKTVLAFPQYGSSSVIRRFCFDYRSQMTPLHKPKGPLKTFLYSSVTERTEARDEST